MIIGTTSFIAYKKLTVKEDASSNKNIDNLDLNPEYVPPRKPVGINTTDELKKDYFFTINNNENKLTYKYHYKDCEDDINPDNSGYCINAQAHINDKLIDELNIELFFYYGQGDAAEAEHFVSDSLNLNNLSIIKGGGKEYIVLGTANIDTSNYINGTNIVITDEDAQLIFHLKDNNSNPGFFFEEESKENLYNRYNSYYVQEDKLIYKRNTYLENGSAYIDTLTVNNNEVNIVSNIVEKEIQINWAGDK